MKYIARSPTRKDQCQIAKPFRSRHVQALLGVIFVLVFTPLMALFLIGDTMSLKVRIGLTVNKPSRLHRQINLHQAAERDMFEFDSNSRPRFDFLPKLNSFPMKDYRSQLSTRQQQVFLEESVESPIDYQSKITDSSSSSNNRKELHSTRHSNAIYANDNNAEVGQQHERQEQQRGEIPHDEDSARSAYPKLGSPNLKVQESPVGWLQYPDLYSDSDETEQLMLQISRNGTLPCHQVGTKTAEVVGLPESFIVKNHGNEEIDRVIRLEAGPVYELRIVSIGENDQPRCHGGDYYETDLSGHLWKSRPPVVDLHNGTYAVRLQMDPRFAGRYTFTVVLLFSNFHALHFHPHKYARLEDIATFDIEFVVPDEIRAGKSSSESAFNSDTELAAAPGLELSMCKHEDFDKKYWSGRWTREKFTEDCEYDPHGRWQCVDLDLECQKPLCEGPVGSLESNGWVYSAHCAFKIFRVEEAWKCLDGKWLFFWGDSNHIDTIRNLLNFVLGFEHAFKFLDRRMDMTFTSPADNRSSVRITSMFNGHSNVSLNYEGLYSLQNEEFAAQLRSYFTGETAPDLMIMNSGLHDGLYWRNVRSFLNDGVEYAAKFWTDVWNNMTARRPDLVYRTTVATGGGSRNMSFNPHKMELFNHLMVDKFLKLELERFQIIDGFDYTFPWHWDHRTNDGVHYGRPPSKTKWAGNNIGHQYFVDLMLVHMLLNAICPAQ